MVKRERYVLRISHGGTRACHYVRVCPGGVVLRVHILPHLRHSGDSLAASPTSKPDLTPYSGVLMVRIYFGDTWETWDTYFQ